MCTCKAKEIAKRYRYNPGKCKLILANFICKLCKNKSKKYYVHDDSGDFVGFSYECANCKEFVKYKFGKSISYEFYLKELPFFIIKIDKKRILISSLKDDNKNTFITSVFKFKDKKDFLNKIETILTFL